MTDLCTVTVTTAPSGANACTQTEANWTVLETIRDYLCCLQTNNLLKKSWQYPMTALGVSSQTYTFTVPSDKEIDIQEDVSEIQVFRNGVQLIPTTNVLGVNPASEGFCNINISGQDIIITFGGTITTENVMIFIPVLTELTC